MLELIKLNGSVIYANPHLIETMDAGTETRIYFMSGNSLVVKDSKDEILEKIINYRKQFGIIAQEF